MQRMTIFPTKLRENGNCLEVEHYPVHVARVGIMGSQTKYLGDL